MRAFIKAISLGLGLGLTGAGASALADDGAVAIFGERQLALAVDDRCHLFTAGQRNALEAGRLQARGLLLREGITRRSLEDYTADLHRQAAGISCADTAVADLQHRVISAYIGWVRIPAMDFPGSHFTWTASRNVTPDMAVWSISQDQGDFTIGVSTRDDRRQLSFALAGQPDATSAILVLRDMDRQPTLYDATMGGTYTGPTNAAWARWTPPRFAETRIWARGRDTGSAAATLAGTEDGATVFDFPMSAADALAARDPREAARIDLMDRHGRIIASHYIEIGDFAAALAFLLGGDHRDLSSPAAPEPSAP
ncbi:hypothetical protein [uncultured Maricaulis sp.]|uniref:hypothetical protein n=1 Tax=uncultured Maricaulis sp. TaxID=174710 RepID=UPI0025D8F4C3|nr:hypothetical protein [uncultured Maricaulis sp.]